jgi:Flp pilus assembly protein CpaB
VFRNRGGALIAGVVVAVIAVILLVVYLHSYRSSVNSGKAPERVLVATKLIPRGTSAALMASQGLYQQTSVPKDELLPLAITDASALQGRVAAGDIFPGQQLTQTQFTTENAGAIPFQIHGRQRAIAVSIDSNHGLIGQLQSGDFVDVYIGTSGGTSGGGGSGLLTLLASDVYVLVAPGGASPNAILRVTTKQAPLFALANDSTRMWFVLRPQVGASPTPPATVTLGSLLAGAKP